MVLIIGYNIINKLPKRAIYQSIYPINIFIISTNQSTPYYLIASLKLSRFSIAMPTPLITQNNGSSTTNEATPV